MGGIKVFTSSITAKTELRKRVQWVLFVLESHKIDHDIVDVAQSLNDELAYLKKHCYQSSGEEEEDDQPSSNAAPELPQLFADDVYCGGYEDFERAVENEELYVFLKLKDRKKFEEMPAEHEAHDETDEDVAQEATAQDVDDDALWQKRQKAKRVKKDTDENEVDDQADADAATASSEQQQQEVEDESEDAALKRRIRRKEQETLEASENELTETAVSQPDVEEEIAASNEDEDSAWKRRMERKKREAARQADNDQPAVSANDETTEQIQENSVTEEDEDVAWQRRMQRKKRASHDQDTTGSSLPIDAVENDVTPAEDCNGVEAGDNNATKESDEQEEEVVEDAEDIVEENE